MFASNRYRQLAIIALAIAAPSIACFGWYSMDSMSAASSAVRTLVVFAYPAALISATFLVLALISARRNPSQVWISALALGLSLAVLIIARI